MAHDAASRLRALEKLRRNRREWFAANGPCRRCGSDRNMELDHIDPSMKVSHTVWSWSPARRAAELSKCQVLCRLCHRKKTALQCRGRVNHKARKISDANVLKAALMRNAGYTVRGIAKKFGVSHATITKLTNRANGGLDFRHRGSAESTRTA